MNMNPPGYRLETERLEDVQGDHLRYLQQITAIRITLKLFPPFSKLYKGIVSKFRF